MAVVTGQQPALFGGPALQPLQGRDRRAPGAGARGADGAAARAGLLDRQRRPQPHGGRSHLRAERRAASSSESRGGTRWGGSSSRSPSSGWTTPSGRRSTSSPRRQPEHPGGATSSSCSRTASARESDCRIPSRGCWPPCSIAYGLVLVDPSEPTLRRLGMPLLAAELAFPSPTTEAAREATTELSARGYPAQVPLRDDRLNLFYGRSERFRLRCGPDGFQMSLKSGLVDAAALRSQLRRGPRGVQPERAAQAAVPGRAAPDGGLRRRAERDRVLRAAEARLRALRDTDAGRSSAAERHARRSPA